MQSGPDRDHPLDACGDRALYDADALKGFAAYANDAAMHERVAAARRANKVALARVVADRLGLQIDPNAMFDVQIKRIHEYKRQLLNILETVALYNAIRANPTHRFRPARQDLRRQGGGELSPGQTDHQARHRRRARSSIRDPTVRGLLKVVFLPNYNVSLAERIIPAADLSEQISTAGMEASGTGNMKMALNGALTIGTLDGANVEIRDRVGDDNIFIFGLTAPEVETARAQGIDASARIDASPMLREALDADRLRRVLP